MKLSYQMPSSSLKSLISIIGHVHSLTEPFNEKLPALLPNLHLRLAGSSRYHFVSGTVHDAPEVVLIGATSAAFRMETSADFEMVCIGFLPVGWRTVIGIPASDISDTLIDAALIWSASEVESLKDAIAGAGTLPNASRLLENFLLRRVASRQCGDLARIHAIREWLEAPGPITLQNLSSRLALCPRQIARITLDNYGASPKTLAMKYRALRAASDLAINGTPALDKALSSYADQSHFIRDFNRFIGWTPQRFLSDYQPLARGTLQGRWVAGAREAMTLLS